MLRAIYVIGAILIAFIGFINPSWILYAILGGSIGILLKSYNSVKKLFIKVFNFLKKNSVYIIILFMIILLSMIAIPNLLHQIGKGKIKNNTKALNINTYAFYSRNLTYLSQDKKWAIQDQFVFDDEEYVKNKIFENSPLPDKTETLKNSIFLQFISQCGWQISPDSVGTKIKFIQEKTQLATKTKWYWIYTKDKFLMPEELTCDESGIYLYLRLIPNEKSTVNILVPQNTISNIAPKPTSRTLLDNYGKEKIVLSTQDIYVEGINEPFIEIEFIHPFLRNKVIIWIRERTVNIGGWIIGLFSGAISGLFSDEIKLFLLPSTKRVARFFRLPIFRD